MAKVTEENLIHLTKLCRIACSKEKRESLLKDFQQIVGYVEQLSKINTEGVEPCSYVTSGHAQTPLRDDVAQNTLDRELFLQGAPSSIAGLVRVPTVLKPGLQPTSRSSASLGGPSETHSVLPRELPLTSTQCVPSDPSRGAAPGDIGSSPGLKSKEGKEG